MQEFINTNENPNGLRIHSNKNKDALFDSFSAKMFDSIKVKSSLIKIEKAENQYEPCCSYINLALFITVNPYNKNGLIINIGIFPTKEKVIFISIYKFTLFQISTFDFSKFL